MQQSNEENKINMDIIITNGTFPILRLEYNDIVLDVNNRATRMELITFIIACRRRRDQIKEECSTTPRSFPKLLKIEMLKKRVKFNTKASEEKETSIYAGHLYLWVSHYPLYNSVKQSAKEKKRELEKRLIEQLDNQMTYMLSEIDYCIRYCFNMYSDVDTLIAGVGNSVKVWEMTTNTLFMLNSVLCWNASELWKIHLKMGSDKYNRLIKRYK